MEIVNGIAYEYAVSYPNGDKAYGHLNPSQEEIDDLNEFISRTWDNLSEEDKQEINEKMRKKYGTKKRA